MGFKKIEKKDMRKKNREANAGPNMVEDDQLNELEKKRKKEKRKAEYCTEEKGAKDAKRGVTDCTISLPNNLEEDCDQHDKTENKKKKKEKNLVVGSESNNAKIREKDFAEVMENHQKENNKRKKKKEKRKPEVGLESNIAEISDKILVRTDDNYLIEKDKSERNKKKKKVRSSKDVSGDIVKDTSASIKVVGKALNSDTNVRETEKKKKKKVMEKADNWEKGEDPAVEFVEKTTNADINFSEKVEKKWKRETNKGKDLKDEPTTHSARKRSEGSETEGDNMSHNDKEPSAVENNTKDSKPKKKKKKVSFSDHDEVFPLEGGIVRGKRFSPEEDEMVKQAVFYYIKAHDLGDEGLTMVLHCKSHSKVKNCWKEIGQALPHRPYVVVYDRAHSLFERDDTRTWSTDELEIIKKYHAGHGSKWKSLADAMGRHRRHVKDVWRRTKLPDTKKGQWSQEEYQTLFDLVNVDLRAKVNQEKKSKHGMLKDNISWTAISDTLASRNNISCCIKWYNQLASSMVKEGEWADTDDYRLIDGLYTLDACCIEDVDWDSLLEHRSGDVCRKRWKQMANHIGENGKKTFVDQVEILSKRYRAELLDAREAWDNKPVVP